MKQWCMQCNRMTEHGTGGCLEHQTEIHITDHTMDKTQEAFEKRKPLPGWPKGVYFVFQTGYEEGQENCKCCGSCKWCDVETNYCNNENSTYIDCAMYIDQSCDKWEAR